MRPIVFGSLRLWLVLGFLLTAGTGRGQEQELLAQARSQGTVRVIVRLDVPYRSEGSLVSPRTVATQRERIAAAQDRLLVEIRPEDIHDTKRFRYIPFLALEVSARGLAGLLLNPRVTGIEEDVAQRLLEIQKYTSIDATHSKLDLLDSRHLR